MASRLDDAVSPYLRAHAGNPVSWYPWDEAAFAEAAARDVPVMISIGYATCHWCHVMARESFSDPAIAELLDARFVAIKVDREEHPEVDAAYLAAASAFTRQLGWPLTVFADASGRAFYAGTYFPPRPVPGVPAFRDVLLAVDEAWRERRAELTATSEALAGALADSSVFGAESPLPSRERLEAAAAILAKGEDPVHGGFGGAPKFPVAPVLSFLAGLGPGERVLAARTLLRMGASALRDPVDGGFFRYATRADWTEPHYERMLSDNALLLNVATDLTAAAERDGSPDAPRLRVLAGELVRFLLDAMRLPGGGFASAQDSESVIDGVRNEGGYYQRDRDGRVGLTPPALDEKVLTGWNGLAVGALARAGALLADETALDAARAAADWLLEHHVPAGHPMVRASRDGAASGAAATLEDFGMLAQGLLALAEASGAHRYAVAARDLVDRALDAAGDGPFGAPPDGPDPVLASRGLVLEADPAEGATPSGVTTIADAARLLHALGAGDRYLDAAHRTLARVAETALSQPIAFGSTLRLLADLDAPLVQVVTVVPDATSGPLDDGVGALIAETRRAEASVAVVVTDAQSRAFADAGFELFVGRSSAGGAGALAYRCEAFTCALPVTDAAALRDLAA